MRITNKRRDYGVGLTLWLGLLIAIYALSGCGDRDVSVEGFVLPDGDAAAGEARSRTMGAIFAMSWPEVILLILEMKPLRGFSLAESFAKSEAMANCLPPLLIRITRYPHSFSNRCLARSVTRLALRCQTSIKS